MIDRVAGAGRFSHHTYALIVGISHYASKGLADLPGCEPEAIKLESALKNPSGCAVPPHQIVRVADAEATTDNIATALTNLCKGRTADDTLVIYLAGHGEVCNGDFIFLTGNADSERGLAASAIDALLNTLDVRGVLLIVDCCSSADLAEHAPSFFRTPHRNEFRLFISASGTGQLSWELLKLGRSLFTHHLLEVLSGRVRIGDGGAIYYHDLYRHLHTAVLEDAQKFLKDAASQVPTATGIHSGDPLLFLHRDLSLAQVRIKTRRITQEHLRRRLAIAIGSVLAIALLGLAGYWAFLDSHQYLRAGNTIALVHGYPRFSGFGLPEEDWQFPFERDAIDPEGALARGDVVFARGQNVGDALNVALRPASGARLLVWQGRVDEALALIRNVDARSIPPPDLLLALQEMPLQGREAELAKLIPELPPAATITGVEALARVDSELAMHAYLGSPASTERAFELTLLSSWSAPCSPSVQQWLDGFVGRVDFIHARTVALTAVVAGCKSPESLVFDDPKPEDQMIALRLTQPDVAKTWAEVLGSELAKLPDRVPANVERTLRVLRTARHASSVPCLPALLNLNQRGVINEEWLEIELTAADLVARGCKQHHLQASVRDSRLNIAVLSGDDHPQRIVSFPLGASAIPPLDVAIAANAKGIAEAAVAMLMTEANPDVRLALIERLNFLHAQASDLIERRAEDRPLLDRAIAELLAMDSSVDASAYLRKLLENATPDSTLVESLALIGIAPADRTAVLAAIARYPALQRTIGLALLGSVDTVARLLTDPQPTVRAWAADYAPLRTDWSQIEARAHALSIYPDPTLATVVAKRAQLREMSELIVRTPEWARPWLLRRVMLLRANSAAEQLHAARLRKQYHLRP